MGTELGVRYVLEGSVRTARERIRVTAQLIDATTSHHVWAERYDRALTDIFDIQDDLTSRIVSAIDFEVRNTEALRPSGTASAGLQVWAQYHAALPLLFRLTAEENRRAAALFDAIRASHPAFAAGYAGYGFALTSDAIYGWAADRQAAAEAALQPCRRAVELDDKDAFCHLTLGRALLIAGERDLGFASVERAVARNPNLALAHMFRGMALVGLERHAEALDSIDLAIRLSPRDPGLWSFYLWRSACRRALGDFAGAVDAAHQMVRERPDLWLTHIELATALVEAQQPEAGKAAVRKALELHPSATVEELARVESLFISPARVRESRRIAAGLGLPSRKTT